jgi:RNA polymerase sigma-70 factor (ECF subfamily)
MIPPVPPLISRVVHEPAHERDPKAAGPPIGERAGRVRRGRKQRVERVGRVDDLDDDILTLNGERQLDGGPPSRQTVADDVRKDLVERQREPPRRALREIVHPAELLEGLDSLKHPRQGAGHGERLDRAHQPASGPDPTTLWYPRGRTNFSASAVYSMAEPDEDVISVARCLRGDASAFDAIVKRYERVLFSLAHRMLGDYEDARDATQNAFVRAYEGLESYDPERRFFSWLYRIAINECLNLKRAQRPNDPLPEDMQAAEAEGPLQAVANLERSEWIDAALVRLSEEHRLVVALRHFADLSYTEMSDVLGLPEKTVKSRLFEARHRLAGLLRLQPGGTDDIRA